MPSRKYRLSEPIDDSKADVSDHPTIPISLHFTPRLTTANDVEINTSEALLGNQQKIKKVPPFTPPARWWIVLPCLVLIIFVSAADSLLLNDLIIRRYERQYGLNTSPNAQSKDCQQSTKTTLPMFYWGFPPPYQMPPQNHPDYTLVQRAAASFHTKNSIVALIPALVTLLFLGSNCDIIGRRPLLVLPLVGKVVWYSLLLIIVSRNLSDAWLLAAHAIESIFGSSGLVTLSAFSFITDCTDASTRTRAFLLTEAIVFVARILPTLAVGIWLRFYLYTGPLSVCLALSVIALLYALFVQPESVESVRNVSLIRQLARIRVKPIVRIATVFTAKRSGNKRQQFMFITVILILLQLVLLGHLSVLTLYLYGRPFCLDALHVSLLNSVQGTVTFLLSLITIYSKKSVDKTYWTAVFGSLAVVASEIIFSLSKKVWLLYIAACIGSLSFIIMPVIRTKLTKMVEANEYALAFIGAGIVETVGQSVMGVAANSIYKASINFFPGLVFLVFGLTGLIPIAMMCYLAFLEKRTSKKINKPTVSRSHVQM